MSHFPLSRIRVLALLLSCLTCTLLSAQTDLTVQGKVLDEEGKGLPYATVQLSLDRDSKQGRLYVVTDTEGRFVIEDVPGDPPMRWLTVRLMGYRTYKRELDLSDSSEITNLRISLRPSAETLSEVVVSTSAPGVYARGDTIVFDSKTYVSGGEQTLGDVIGELPGMQIDDRGQLTFQGSPIHKILINNKDLLTTDTSTALDTFSSDFADEIEVINDYKDGDIGGDFKTGKQRALNLKTKHPIRTTGRIALAAGAKGRYAPSATTISVKDKLSLCLRGAGTNTGDPLITESEVSTYSTLYPSISTQEKPLPLPPGTERLSSSRPDEYSHSGAVGGVSLAWRPGAEYRLHSTTLLHESRGAQSGESRYEYSPIASEESRSTYGESYKRHQRALLLTQQIGQRWIPSDRFALQSTLQAALTRDRDRGEFLSSVHSQPNGSRETLSRHYRQLGGSAEAKYLLGKGLLYGGVYAVLEREAKEESLETSLPQLLKYLSLPEPSDGEYRGVAFNLSDKRLSTQLYVGSLLPLKEDLLAKAEISATSDRHSAEYLSEEKEIDPTIERLSADRLEGYLGLSKSKGFLQIDGGAGLSYARHSFLSLAPTIEYRKLSLHPLAQITLHFDEGNDLIFYGEHRQLPVPMERLSRVGWIDDHSRVRQSSIITHPGSRMTDAMMLYSFINLRHRLFFFSHLSYHLSTDNGRMEVVESGPVSHYRYLDGGREEILQGAINFSSALFRSPIDISVGLKGSITETPFILHGAETLLRSRRLHSDIGLTSRFRHSPVNASLRLYSDIRHWSDSRNHSGHRLTESGGSLALKGRHQALSYQISGTYKRLSESEEKSRQELMEIDLEVYYKWGKWTASIRGKDLLHLDGKEWLLETVHPGCRYSQYYRSLPGYFMIGLEYHF